MIAEQFYQESFSLAKGMSLEGIRVPKEYSSEEYYQEFYSRGKHSKSYYYRFLAACVRLANTHVACEVGGANGSSALAILSSLPPGGKLFSCDLADGWKYVNDNRLIKIVGDSLGVDWPEEAQKAQFWLIDGEHQWSQVKREIERFLPWWEQTKDVVVVFDDIFHYPEVHGYLKGRNYYSDPTELHGGHLGILMT